MEYSVCINAVFRGVPAPEALRRVRAAGYGAFEFWGWWDQDVEALAAAIRETGLRPAAHCTRMIPLTDPSRRGEYLLGLRESAQTARRLGCGTLISQVGSEIPSLTRAEQHASIVEGLRQCLPVLEEENLTLVIEPLNLRTHPGYYLDRSDEAFEIIREVDSPRVRVLFDVFHQQITEGDLIETLTKNVALIGHIHIAGNPGRHEPLRDSEVCYPAVLRALKTAGYDGAVGLEYFPLAEPEEGLREILEQMPL